MRATQTPKKTNTTKISLGRVLPRLDSTSDAPVKLVFLILYILGAVLIWYTQADIAASTEKIEYISPIAEFAARNVFITYLIIAGVAVTILILTPIGKRAVQDQLKSIGLVNHAEAVPELKSKRKDKQNPRISIWEFTSQGIPLKVWKDKQAAIETALDITIVKMKNGSGKSRVLIHAVPAVSDLPDMIKWKDKYLSQQSFILNLGESFTGPVTVDLARVPHILLGGATGSGKSVSNFTDNGSTITMNTVGKGGKANETVFRHPEELAVIRGLLADKTENDYVFSRESFKNDADFHQSRAEGFQLRYERIVAEMKERPEARAEYQQIIRDTFASRGRECKEDLNRPYFCRGSHRASLIEQGIPISYDRTAVMMVSLESHYRSDVLVQHYLAK